MASLNANLSLGNKTFSISKNYTQIFEQIQEVDNADGFINILSVSSTKGASTVSAIKSFCIQNTGLCAAEIQLKFQEWKNNSNVDEKNSVDLGGGATVDRYVSIFLAAGEFFYLPHGRMIGYNADASAANATEIDNTAPNSNMYVDSTADVDDGTGLDIIGQASETKVFLEPYTSETNCTANLFKIGDLIRVNNEIMEVTAIGDKSDLANNYLTVKRGMFGSTAASDHADDAAIRFPFFNAYNRFNKYSVSQTNDDGKFRSMNFFGYGRTLDAIADGIQPGSVAIKFYNSGYQELGLSGITANTNTGLSTSTTYQFTIAVDGGSAYDLDLTTDSSNVNWGGANGIIAKLNDIFRTQFYTAGNLFEKRVSVAIMGGDIRFTSGSHLSTSAIALGDSSGGDTDIWAAGRIPAVANIEGAVAARLPDDTLYNSTTYETTKNKGAFLYDTGHGNLTGIGQGKINYETGEINFTVDGLPNAEFVVSCIHKSAHSGGINADTANGKNTIQSIGARSISGKMNTNIKVVAYN